MQKKWRSQGWTKKRLDNRLTENEVATAGDLRELLNEVITEARDASGASLALETALRIKLRAVEIDLRVIEITDHERRIVALEEHANPSTRVRISRLEASFSSPLRVEATASAPISGDPVTFAKLLNIEPDP
ncbi:MAG TPA: hypothetical protein VEF35_01375 [Candidatus Bathyarchaeia archaeon]|nr:hypothetical protein [Candidatus Bathyarchaeia archaeon]